jgi:hypothetical protein
MLAKTSFITISLALALSACATHRINYSNPSVPAGGATKDYRQSFYLWGLVGGKEVDLARECPSGVAKIESKSSAIDGILAAITAGIYSPMSVHVQCAGGQSASLETKP